MTIGSFIYALEKLPADTPVAFSDGIHRDEIDSWRCVYAEATLTYADKPTTAGDLLRQAREAVSGKTYHGYKGGEYSYDRDTPLWADDYGACTHNMLVGADFEGGRLTFQVVQTPYEYIL